MGRSCLRSGGLAESRSPRDPASSPTRGLLITWPSGAAADAGTVTKRKGVGNGPVSWPREALPGDFLHEVNGSVWSCPDLGHKLYARPGA